MNKIANFLNARISGLVTDKPEILAAYSRDASILEIMPKLLCLPQTVEDIQYIVRFADELAKKGYRLPISVRGSGLDQSGADLSEGIVLSTEKLNKIQEIDDRERLVRVQAGVTLGQLNSALALFGLRLPVEADERETIGGIVSNFYTDKIAKKYGSIYYYVDRIEAVLSSGELFQSQSLTPHGLRNAKSYTGLSGQLYQGVEEILTKNKEQVEILKADNHSRIGFHMISEVYSKKHDFDLLPLYFGAQGSLGIITELILRVVPLSRPTKKALFIFEKIKPAIEFMTKLQQLQPLRIDFYDTRIFKTVPSYKAKSSFINSNTQSFLISIEFDDSYFKNHSNLKKLRQITGHDCQSLIDQPDIVGQFEQIAKSMESYRNDAKYPERVIIADRSYIPQQELASFIESLTTLEKMLEQELPVFGSFATGLFSVRPVFDLSFIEERKRLLRFMQQYGKLIIDSNGNFCGGSAEGLVQAIMTNQDLPAKTRALYHDIKNLFDPNNILNPKIKQHATLANVVRFMRTSPQIGLIRQD